MFNLSVENRNIIIRSEYQNDLRAGSPLLQGEAEKVGAGQSEEEEVKGGSYQCL